MPELPPAAATTSRPACLVLVVGTATEVGKTWVAERILSGLRAAGLTVAARKPAQSFDPHDPAEGTDAAVLSRASGESPETVCPPHRWYPVAMAPPMAAEALGRPAFSGADLVQEIRWPSGVDVGLVETAGGVRSPQADDADVVGLAALLRPELIVLVADAGLGTINSVRLSVEALASAAGHRGFDPVMVVLNRFDPTDELHCRNATWLADRCGLSVITLPSEEGELIKRVAETAGQR